MIQSFLYLLKKIGWDKGFVFSALLLNFLYHLLFVHVVIFNNDEAISAVAGVEIAHGGIAYKNAVDHRGPVTYYLYALAYKIGEDYNMALVRILFACIIVVSGWVLFKSVELINSRLGIISCFVFCLLSVYGSTGDFLACHTEWPMVLFMSSAAYFLVKNLVSDGSLKFNSILSGIFMALAIFSKQVAVFDILAMGLMYFVISVYSKKFNQMIFDAFWIALGALLVITLVVLYFIFNDAIQDFIFYTFTYNSAFYMRERMYNHFLNEMISQMIWFFQARNYLIFLGLPAFLMSIILFKKGSNFFNLLFLGILMFSVALIGTCLSGRPFGHYQIQLLPYISFLIGLVIYNAMLFIKNSKILFGIGLIVSLLFYVHMYKIHSQDLNGFFDKDKVELLSYVENNKTESDKLFIWGFNAEPYVYLNMRPASRYSFCNFQTGLLPFINKEHWENTESTIVPGSRNQLLNDLKESKPRFIIDSSPANYYFYGKYPISSFPDLENFIRNNYFKVNLKPNQAYAADLYKRKY